MKRDFLEIILIGVVAIASFLVSVALIASLVTGDLIDNCRHVGFYKTGKTVIKCEIVKSYAK